MTLTFCDQIMADVSKLQDLNARQILNVQTILHVFVKNVKTHARLIPVVSMPNAKSKDTEHSAFVSLDMKEIRTPFVKNVST